MLEQSRGALINVLVLRENVFLFPINPKQLVAYRESFQNTKAKNDKQDSNVAGSPVIRTSQRDAPLEADDEQTRLLNNCVSLDVALLSNVRACSAAIEFVEVLLSSLAFTGKLQTLQLPTASKASWSSGQILANLNPASSHAESDL